MLRVEDEAPLEVGIDDREVYLSQDNRIFRMIASSGVFSYAPQYGQSQSHSYRYYIYALTLAFLTCGEGEEINSRAKVQPAYDKHASRSGRMLPEEAKVRKLYAGKWEA
jgi:hypothetical protein